jgi:co-chaperonin GroES (HSP10)
MKNKSGINPTGHYILILPDEVEKKSKGGLYLANETIDNAERDTTQGTLIAVGPIGWAEFGKGTPWAKAGDKVSFGRHAGRDMTGSDGQKYVLMNCEDILAVLDV